MSGVDVLVTYFSETGSLNSMVVWLRATSRLGVAELVEQFERDVAVIESVSYGTETLYRSAITSADFVS